MLNLLGTLPFLWMIETRLSPVLLMLCLIARGSGQGAIGIPTIAASYASLPKEKLPTGTTALNLVQRLGGPIWTTILAIIMSLLSTHSPVAGPRAFLIPFLAFIGLHLILLLSASRLPERIHQKN